MDVIREHKKLIIILLSAMTILLLVLGGTVFFITSPNRLSDESDSQKDSYRKRYIEYSPALRVQQSQIDMHIAELSSEKYEGRRAGTPGEAEASLYLARELKKMGYTGYFDNQYFQRFPVPKMSLLESKRRYYLYPVEDSEVRYADNVVGRLGKEDVARYIILSANYDHLGKLDSPVPRAFHGANRNASGVAAVLEIARIISENIDEVNYHLIVAFWSGHEAGLLGSKAFTEQLTESELAKVALVINLDTIGVLGSPHYIAEKENDLPDFFINETISWTGINIVVNEKEKYNGDHIRFAKKNIPSVTIISENWQQGTASFNDTYFGVDTSAVKNLAQHITNYLYWLEGE